MSKFIVLEGGDRCGKATQSYALLNYIMHANKKLARVIEVPVHSWITYHIIYWMLGNGAAKLFPTFFQILQYINRQIFQWFTLPRLEKTFDYIIMDRWYLSTIVYGEAEGVSPAISDWLCNKLRKPDFTILLLGESHNHISEDVYESDKSLQKNVRYLYQKWAQTNPNECEVINCNLPREEVTSKIIFSLKEKGLL